ncbi:unnamed protein product [Caenorhabditis auriculariae]|uniref:Uncharacterized protein n=1 Tax=Caenorhabditis auriculariae TaxID=2777116 RepID=A0A8S1GNK2_9PELO|nr:unnamed protein product [Caenorhabditis auriculariae]
MAILTRFLPFLKSPEYWIERWRSLFFSVFAKKPLKPVQAPVFEPPKPPVVQKVENKTMHTSSVVKAAAARVPMIKFLGARHPRPHFDRSSLPPLQVSGNIQVAKAEQSNSPAKASSIGSVGKLPRGSGIEESQLPQNYRRRPISEEECDAINSGFFYTR